MSDPIRRRILERLASGDKTAGELGEGFKISQPAVSKHLRVLRKAGLVVSEARSQRRLYRLSPAPLADVFAWLERCQGLWQERIESLKSYAERAGPVSRIPIRYPGRVSLDLTGWETGRWRSMPVGAPRPINRTAA